MCMQSSTETTLPATGHSLEKGIGLPRRQQLLQAVEEYESGRISRRQFVQGVQTLIGAGAVSALLAACTPQDLAAFGLQEGVGTEEAETASAADLVTSMVTYGDEDALEGHLALPASTPAPAVLVIQEWWGLNPHIKDVANRFAQAGYVALAPDLYHGQVATEPTEARKLVMAMDRVTALEELDVAARHLLDLDATSGSRVGIVGFCLGGGMAQSFAAHNPLNGAAISFYGAPISDAEASQVHGALMTIWGADDGAFPIPRTEQLENALNAASIPNRRLVYEGAGHAFFNDTRAAYHAEAAADAWENSLEWFATHLQD